MWELTIGNAKIRHSFDAARGKYVKLDDNMKKNISLMVEKEVGRVLEQISEIVKISNNIVWED